MRNPYKPRRDYTPIVTWILGGLALLTVVMLAIYLMRPTASVAQHREEAALERQMDQAEVAAAKKERERIAALQSDLP